MLYWSNFKIPLMVLLLASLFITNSIFASPPEPVCLSFDLTAGHNNVTFKMNCVDCSLLPKNVEIHRWDTDSSKWTSSQSLKKYFSYDLVLPLGASSERVVICECVPININTFYLRIKKESYFGTGTKRIEIMDPEFFDVVSIHDAISWKEVKTMKPGRPYYLRIKLKNYEVEFIIEGTDIRLKTIKIQ